MIRVRQMVLEQQQHHQKREAGKILNCPVSYVPLSPRYRTHRTKWHTPASQAKRSRPGNTSSQPAAPFPFVTSSPGPFSLLASPVEPAGEATAAILSPPQPAQTSTFPPSGTAQTGVQPRGEEGSSSESEQEERHSSDNSSSS
ncbi:hypothetical protein HPB50_023431 [Hyalomma asiaticum]|uniref:Uncharacterized protein n=1 Tax=Hyalomma asiaticum TaxID=266040 RepID=A0ACB7RYK7_HYAAI|nr:hypothetical protein HPB50_023431 [Hyalomma asiaticum]